MSTVTPPDVKLTSKATGPCASRLPPLGEREIVALPGLETTLEKEEDQEMLAPPEFMSVK